jgi:hypothetical protein
MSEWIEAIDSIAAVKAAAQVDVDLERALVVNQEQMQTDHLMMWMNDKARRKEEAYTAYAAIVQDHEDSQAEVLQTIESDAGSDISELDPVEEEGIRNLQPASHLTSSVTTVSKRIRSSSSLLASRSSSVKRGKSRATEEDVVA